MPISLLRIANFRNLINVNIEPVTNGLNLISGDNGSGKTSILEAIYFIGYSRSFRTSTTNKLIKSDVENFSLFAQIVSDLGIMFPVGIERFRNGISRFRVAEKDSQNIAEVAASLPIRLIHSQSHQIFEAGPQHRRKYLDWGLFYQYDSFLQIWRNFERTLKQRNSLLKDKKSKKEVLVWTKEFVKQSLLIDEFRHQYISALKPYLFDMIAQLLAINDIDFKYDAGWESDESLEAILERHLDDEYRLGYSLYGPHRADFDIKISNHSAKHFLSRGQQKLLICAMILAQGLLLSQHKKSPIYLVDDLPSELDMQSRKKLISLLAKQQSQIFITAIEQETIIEFLKLSLKPIKLFHVKHGSVIELASTSVNLRSTESEYEHS